jgi:thiol-disulfide isomerase/thioredoxin
VRRLDLEGKAMSLSGPTLSDANRTADLSELRGKLVIVYYWASWNGQAASDFAKLKAIASANAKDVAVLTVNLDATPEEAKSFVAKNSPVGTHLYQKGGLDSKLATDYGVMVLPSAFLVGKDGKCLNRSAQVSTLEDEVKKQLKK